MEGLGTWGGEEDMAAGWRIAGDASQEGIEEGVVCCVACEREAG